MALTSTYQNNATTKSPPTTVGIKIAKPGYDALTASGGNLVFDSSWPSLPIAFEKAMTNPITSNISTATIPHGLTYAPFCMGWAYNNDPSGINNVGSRFFCMSDEKNIYLNGNSNAMPPLTASKIILRAFVLDMSVDKDYPLAPGSTYKTTYDPNYGIKVVLPNKSIGSTDMRDFSLHSRCQSPLILAVKTEKTSNPANTTVVQYKSSLSYPVWVYGFIKLGTNNAVNYSVPANTYYPAPYYSQAYPKTETDGTLSYISFNSGSSVDNGATLIILRDPMFASTQTTVTY